MLEGPEIRLWERLADERAEYGVPKAACAVMRPVPFLAVILSIVIFFPSALILGFWVKRQAVLIQGDEVVVARISIFRYRIEEISQRVPLRSAEVSLDGSKLFIDGERYWVDPGFKDSAARIVELAGA